MESGFGGNGKRVKVMESDKTYNGWANYETWNVALWIDNDEGLYSIAKEMRGGSYADFAEMMREEFSSTETPDGVAWNDSGLDTDELDAMLREMRGEEVEA